MSEENKPENVGAVPDGDGATTERRWTTVVGKSDEGRGGRRQFGPVVQTLVGSRRVKRMQHGGGEPLFLSFYFFQLGSKRRRFSPHEKKIKIQPPPFNILLVHKK